MVVSAQYTEADKRRWRRRSAAIVIVSLALVAVILVLGHRSFKETARAAVQEFGRRQAVLADGATHSIELYFRTLSTALRPLALDAQVQRLEEAPTRSHLKLKAEELRAFGVWDVGVIDAAGKLRYSATDSPMEGADFSSRRYYQDAKAATSSDTRVVQFVDFEGIEPGMKGVLVGVPMFEAPAAQTPGASAGRFAGLVGCVVKLDYMAREFIAPVRSTENGRALLIDEEGGILWSADRTMFGKNLLKECEGFPSFQQVVTQMTAAETGAAEFTYYAFDVSTGRYTSGTETKLIAFAPVRAGQRPWAIGVWAPKADALKSVRSANRTQHMVVGFSTLVVLAGAALALTLCARFHGILEREVDAKTRQLKEKQEQIEKSRRELADAAVKVSELIETTALDQSLKTWYDNPNLVSCWKIRSCANTWCPCHGTDPMRCWQTEGTYCDRTTPAPFAEKVLKCRSCEVFRQSCPDRLTELAEGFNNMILLLKRKAEEMRQLRYHALQRERMATIGQMAAGIAHEVGNPIASLFSLVQILKETDLDEETRGRLALMEQCVARISRIVREVVEFGRPIASEDWTYGDVERVVQDTVNLLRYDRRARQVDLRVDFEANLPKTMIIEHQLQQVFMNILVNALDAMGGHGELTVRGCRANGAIEVAISDTGAGMDREQIQRIFEPFYTTKAAAKGAGLGLALSYNTMQRHGGTIRVESKVGEGTTFIVSIPLREPGGEQ